MTIPCKAKSYQEGPDGSRRSSDYGSTKSGYCKTSLNEKSHFLEWDFLNLKYAIFRSYLVFILYPAILTHREKESKERNISSVRKEIFAIESDNRVHQQNR
jgi:hypothetical protein